MSMRGSIANRTEKDSNQVETVKEKSGKQERSEKQRDTTRREIEKKAKQTTRREPCHQKLNVTRVFRSLFESTVCVCRCIKLLYTDTFGIRWYFPLFSPHVHSHSLVYMYARYVHVLSEHTKANSHTYTKIRIGGPVVLFLPCSYVIPPSLILFTNSLCLSTFRFTLGSLGIQESSLP